MDCARENACVRTQTPDRRADVTPAARIRSPMKDRGQWMRAADVLELYATLEHLGVLMWIDGGWGVDALLGKETHSHGDLDIAIEHKDAPKARALLEQRGYREAKRDSEWNFVLADASGHSVDFHLFVRNKDGQVVDGTRYPDESLTGTGTIAGTPVRCIAPEYAVQFRTAYTPRERDLHDVAALCEKFGLSYPHGYAPTGKHADGA